MGSVFVFVISVLVAPLLGWFAADHGMAAIAAYNEVSTAEAWAYCSDPSVTTSGCTEMRLLMVLHHLAVAGLVATAAIPLLYWICAALLARDRDLLARFFPPLVRVFLVLLPLLLVAHGLLVWVAGWKLLEQGMLPNDWRVLAAIALVGAGLVFAAFCIVVELRRLLELEPLRATGIVVEKSEYPELFARVARIATKLGSREPERIVLGIEPNAYVAAVPMRLRGVGDLPQAETLYLSTVALRILDDAELDALIGHELGHFRGADLEFSSRFAPVFTSLGHAVQSVALDDDDEENGWIRLGRMPAVGLLSLMIYILDRAVSGIGRMREFAADAAAVEVSHPKAIVSLLIKFNVIGLHWGPFQRGVSALLHRGMGRRNLSLDYLARTGTLLDAIPAADLRTLLLEARTPHPLDTHPSLAARAAAVGVDPQSLITASLAALRVPRPVPPVLRTIEERITAIEVDYSRVPGHPVAISEEEALPPELAG